nr:hypothetical protein [Candidatus Sigynarchaeota archaeon]
MSADHLFVLLVVDVAFIPTAAQLKEVLDLFAEHGIITTPIAEKTRVACAEFSSGEWRKDWYSSMTVPLVMARDFWNQFIHGMKNLPINLSGYQDDARMEIFNSPAPKESTDWGGGWLPPSTDSNFSLLVQNFRGGNLELELNELARLFTSTYASMIEKIKVAIGQKLAIEIQ